MIKFDNTSNSCYYLYMSSNSDHDRSERNCKQAAASGLGTTLLLLLLIRQELSSSTALNQSNSSPTPQSTPHQQLRHNHRPTSSTIPSEQFHKEFSLLSEPVKASDGHSELVVVQSITDQTETSGTALFLSLDSGKSYQPVTHGVVDVAWSPYDIDGSNPLFVTVEQNMSATPTTTSSPFRLNLYEVSDGIVRRVDQRGYHSDSLFNGEPVETQPGVYTLQSTGDSYDWVNVGKYVALTAHEVITQANPDGAISVIGRDDVQLKTQLDKAPLPINETFSQP